MRSRKVDLVLEGGGVLGVSFIGALKALEEKGYVVNRIAGASAGAFMASLIDAGYTSEALIDMLETIDMRRFAIKTMVARVPVIGNLLSLLLYNGIHRGSGIRELLNERLGKKGLTFRGNETLKIIATDVTNRRLMIIPDCLDDYGVSKDRFLIADAVVMSTAIPYYYLPYLMKHKGKVDYCVDGGILSNFPVWIFDRQGEPRWPTFGLKIKDKDSHTSKGRTGLIRYSKDIIRTIVDKDETVYLSEADRVRTILIDHDASIGATDFDLSPTKLYALIDNGYQSTKRFLIGFDFDRYCVEHRRG